ncbi:AAA+ ATPase superfamily predicted ATPase [Methanococcus voltae]|uniref:AAA+ ATPase superfamily predicted ATPase n=1 Tax=Methanococcus voltae TaxID=2188 RepID=A0A8J7UR30_METVO|nr:hypothetical protein [Methanococcus voltae]MBP2201358.1 AAA+ ATPase superfamily predicted ATPase [Methanococcus voltae]
MNNDYLTISELIKLKKEKVSHLAFIIYGARGMGKTTCLRGMYEEIKKHTSYSTIFAYDVEDIDICDCLFLDDFGTKFNKRDFATVQNKEFMKLLQEVRTNIPIIVSSSPSYLLLDKDFRTFFNPAPILAKNDKMFIVSLMGKKLYVKHPTDKFNKQERLKENKGRKERFYKHLDTIKQAKEKKKK